MLSAEGMFSVTARALTTMDAFDYRWVPPDWPRPGTPTRPPRSWRCAGRGPGRHIWRRCWRRSRPRERAA